MPEIEEKLDKGIFLSPLEMFKEIYNKKLVNTLFDKVNLISSLKSPRFCREYCI